MRPRVRGRLPDTRYQPAAGRIYAAMTAMGPSSEISVGVDLVDVRRLARLAAEPVGLAAC